MDEENPIIKERIRYRDSGLDLDNSEEEFSDAHNDKQREKFIEEIEENVKKVLNPSSEFPQQSTKMKINKIKNCQIGDQYNITNNCKTTDTSDSWNRIYSKIIREMKLHYSTKYFYMRSLLWDGEGYSFPLKDFFVDFNMKDDDIMGYEKVSKSISLEETFETDCSLYNRILITGDPGFGKTTLVKKLLYDWATKKPHNYMSKFDLVLYIPLKKLCDCTVSEALNNILFEEKKDAVSLKHMELNLLVLLDGFDSVTNKKSVLEFIRKDSIEMCKDLTILVTSRPHAVREIRSLFQRKLSIVGFSKEDQRTYIEKIFDPVQSQLLIFQLHKNDFLSSLLNCPLMLHMLCFAHKDSNSLHKSISSVATLYIEIFNLFMNRVRKRHPECYVLEQGKFLLGESLLIKLGKVIWNYIHLQGEYLGIPAKYLKTAVTAEEYLMITKLDFLVLSTNMISQERITVYDGFHSTFIEFLCAVYLVQTKRYEIIKKIFYDALTGSWKSYDTDAIMRFLCGLIRNNKELSAYLTSDFPEMPVVELKYLSMVITECNDEVSKYFCSKTKVIQCERYNPSFNDVIYILERCPLEKISIPLKFKWLIDAFKVENKNFLKRRLIKTLILCKYLRQCIFKVDLKICYIFYDKDKQYCYLYCPEIFLFMLYLSNIRIKFQFHINVYSFTKLVIQTQNTKFRRNQSVIIDERYLIGLVYHKFHFCHIIRNCYDEIEYIIHFCDMNLIYECPTSIIFLMTATDYCLLAKSFSFGCAEASHFTVIFKEDCIINIERIMRGVETYELLTFFPNYRKVKLRNRKS